MKTSQQIQAMRASLLLGYDKEGRVLPWRIRPEDRAVGIYAEPYKVWLSEIMCQQTTTTAASVYWLIFLKMWPTVQDLAKAPRDDVLAAWAGLGFYARARNLHKCAKVICEQSGGVFPQTEEELLNLPGIGPYTAAAIAAICFDQAANVVDGNVERVISRIFRVQAPLPKAKQQIRKLAGLMSDPVRPGDYAQALMDLGAHICKPKNPKCDVCPWVSECACYLVGDMQDYPKRMPKTPRLERFGAVFVVQSGGYIWLRRRPENGLLGGMMEMPGTNWLPEKQNKDFWLRQAPMQSNWHRIHEDVKHVFTHFTLFITVFTADLSAQASNECFEIKADLSKIQEYALPSLMHKILAKAQIHQTWT